MAIITGCGKTNETTPPATTLMPAATQTGGKEMLPPAHPPIGKPAIHPVSGNQLKVITPPEVAAKWKAVELSILAVGRAELRLRIPVGSQQALAATDLTLSVIAYLPSFKVNGDSVTSSSINAENPAVLLRLKNLRGKLAEGWVFQKLPQFNTFHSDKVAVTLIEASPAVP
ncbi:MAG: hypothetical protein AAB134_04200 [Pseudomonadota bacterium]